MSDQHDSFLDALPSGWRYDRLKDVVALRNEKTDEANADEDYLELEDLGSGTGRILSRRNTLQVESAVTLFKKGDVLFGKLRPYLEKYWEAEFDGKCTGEILAFKPERIASRFLFYCVGSRWFIERCNAFAYGAKMPRVSWPTQLSQFNIPLPPLPEQRRIAAYLDASCAAIDAAVAAKSRQLETLDALRKSTIKHAVTMGLNPSVKTQGTDLEWIPEMPQHWRLVRVKDVMQFFNTVRVPLSAAERGVMIERTYDYYGASGVIDKVEAYLFDGTYILIAEDGANLLTRSKPLAFLAAGRFWVNNHAHILQPRWGGDDTFFVNLLESQDFSLFVTGAAQPKLTMENLGRFKLAVPRVAEQKEIAAFIREKGAEFGPLFAQIERQIGTLVAYRKSLIHECVTGQRRVAAIEFARRRIKPEGLKITTPADVLPLIRHFADRKQEHFVCVTINGANEVLNIRVVSSGLLDRAPAHPREVFADALTDRASAIVLAHNHPEGGLEPSPADVDVTRQIKQAGEILGIHLLDHIIFNPTGYFSFLEAGKL